MTDCDHKWKKITGAMVHNCLKLHDGCPHKTTTRGMERLNACRNYTERSIMYCLNDGCTERYSERRENFYGENTKEL